MADSYLINTGDPRSVTGHVASGAFASGIISSAINYNKFKNGQMSSGEAVQNTIKVTAQGGIATGAAISTANHLGPAGGGLFQALTVLSLGMAGIYAVEVADQMLTKNLSKNAEKSLESSDVNEAEHDDENIIVSGE